MQNYEKFMEKCFELAKQGLGSVSPNPLVGCVILDKNNNEISTGFHKKYGENHAERDALLKLENDEARGGTLIVNLEPCSHYGKTPPCADLIIEKGLKKVVIAMRDVNPIVAGNGIKKLQNAGIEVVEGVLEQQAKELNAVFIKNMTEQKIYTAIKTATTIDGKIATSNGSSMWITSEESRNFAKEIRSWYDCVLTTSSTVIADNPRFECKTKVLIDRELKCDFSMQYFNIGKIYVATSCENLPKAPDNVEFVPVSQNEDKLNLQELFENLYKIGLRSVLIESGGTFNGSIIDENLADKIYCFIAPKILGDNSGKSSFAGRNILNINNCMNFKFIQFKKISEDIFCELIKV